MQKMEYLKLDIEKPRNKNMGRNKAETWDEINKLFLFVMNKNISADGAC